MRMDEAMILAGLKENADAAGNRLLDAAADLKSAYEVWHNDRSAGLPVRATIAAELNRIAKEVAEIANELEGGTT